jgi:hypothetical protein
VIVPDLDCECNSRYRIISATCDRVYAGDLDDDKEVSGADIIELLNVVGNTINAETTERKILGGELDLLDFIKSDLNEDGTVDGTDIELIEDAVDGYVNFSIEESFNVLILRLENILEEDDYPVLIDTSEDSASSLSGVTISGEDTLTFITELEAHALAVRVGDVVTIPSEAVDSGEYLIYAKTVDETGTGVSLSLTDMDDGEVSFLGDNNFDITVTSGTRVNTFADNFKLLNVPFQKTNWAISYVGAPHEEAFVNACDLRRYVETNFIEEFEELCICDEDACFDETDCVPQYKNQKVLANDLFLPNGEIYKEPGIPYHGDIEYSSITIPMPPGTIEDCSIDLYTNFIKADSGTCKTASGYPAMKYSDGTYVGCEDSGANTDITKGRVKLTQCIASLYVDAFVDGYAVDGYADETETATSAEVIAESFTDHSYPNDLGFSEWDTPSSGTYVTATAYSGPNEPVYFDLSTINAGYRYGLLKYPEATIADLSGDFIIDFRMSRTGWDEEALKFGQVSFFASLVITNDDGTEATLKLGWRQSAYEEVEMFFSGVIEDSVTILSDFDYSITASDDLGDEIRFRIRRINEAVFGMYFDDTQIDSSENITGQYIKIGTTPDMQPGSGDTRINVEISQDLNPNVGVIYSGILHDMVLKHGYEAISSSDEESLAVGRDSDSLINRITTTFPIMLTQRTNIISASLEMTVTEAVSTVESFNIIPYDIISADNLGTVIDYPLEENHSFVVTFSPGELAVGDTINVDITSLAIYYLSQVGHLPGFYKALIIEPSSTAEAEMFISPSISFIIEYEDITTGVVFKVGASIDPSTGIVSLQTKNILYDSLNEANRTVLKFGVFLKKSGFKNSDVSIGIKDLARVGIGTCIDETEFKEEELCFFIAGDTATGTFVEGPFPCYFHLP